MILYTPLSETDIFPTDEQTLVKRQCMTHQGKMCFVEQKGDGSYEMLQLLSTDPNDFLNGDFQPGTIIK
ncbi:YlzJ-like family protein [Lentibacillus saliphilus]|uniref:YlzJ-like family protein n=1 Tax=Lentibacillus saliphilus TaxID=2737028 RepID=UPI001C2F11E3|nr:YlzJ-like family protein [Lentibacillus saliphilus]